MSHVSPPAIDCALPCPPDKTLGSYELAVPEMDVPKGSDGWWRADFAPEVSRPGNIEAPQ